MSSISTPHPEQEPLEEIEIFELITRVIPHHETSTLRRIAKLYGCSEQTIRKWRNDPAADDDDEGDAHGRRSPVDNLLQFLDALNAVDSARVETVWSRLEYEVAKMLLLKGRGAMMRNRDRLNKANSLALELLEVTDLHGEKDDG